jgi:hypothetical protein
VGRASAIKKNLLQKNWQKVCLVCINKIAKFSTHGLTLIAQCTEQLVSFNEAKVADVSLVKLFSSF